MQIINVLFQQLIASPASALIIVPVSIVAFYLELWPRFPSKMVPVVCLTMGSIMYPLLTRPTTVPEVFPYPIVVLIINGFILGFISMIMHAKVIKRYVIDQTDTSPTDKTPDSK